MNATDRLRSALAVREIRGADGLSDVAYPSEDPSYPEIRAAITMLKRDGTRAHLAPDNPPAGQDEITAAHLAQFALADATHSGRHIGFIKDDPGDKKSVAFNADHAAAHNSSSNDHVRRLIEFMTTHDLKAAKVKAEWDKISAGVTVPSNGQLEKAASEDRCVYRSMIVGAGGFAHGVLDAARVFARRDSGSEVGGIAYIRSWPRPGAPIRIAAISGPKPGQLLYEDSFHHDREWNSSEIDRLEKDGCVPIGTWHSHNAHRDPRPTVQDMNVWRDTRVELGLERALCMILLTRDLPATPFLFDVRPRGSYRGDVDVCSPLRFSE